MRRSPAVHRWFPAIRLGRPQESHTVTVPGGTTGNRHRNRHAGIGLPELPRASRDGRDGRDGSFLKFRWASAPRLRPSLPPAKDLPGRSAGNRHNRHHRHGSLGERSSVSRLAVLACARSAGTRKRERHARRVRSAPWGNRASWRERELGSCPCDPRRPWPSWRASSRASQPWSWGSWRACRSPRGRRCHASGRTS